MAKAKTRTDKKKKSTATKMTLEVKKRKYRAAQQASRLAAKKKPPAKIKKPLIKAKISLADKKTHQAKKKKCPNIYEYLDYRTFIDDMFYFNKAKLSVFSYRYFNKKAGFHGANFLMLVMQGKRNLTNESVGKIARGFELKSKEREFLEYLVFMNQATIHDEKNYYYKKMMDVKGYAKVKKIEKNAYEYFSKWYYPVIREIVVFGSRKHSPTQIANMLDPPINPGEAKRALALLVKLGLIRKNPSGKWGKTDKALMTEPEVRSFIIAKFHREMLKFVVKAIDKFPQEKLDISGVTLSINSQNMNILKEKISAFRHDLMEFACHNRDSNQVIQVAVQAFPLSLEVKKRKTRSTTKVKKVKK